MHGGLSFSLILPETVDSKSISRSPLAARRPGPISVRINGFSPPFAERGWSHSMNACVREISVGMPKPRPKGPISLALIIRQRVDLQRIPYSLTLPVMDKKVDTPEWRY
jgi:hypothetical protein